MIMNMLFLSFMLRPILWLVMMRPWKQLVRRLLMDWWRIKYSFTYYLMRLWWLVHILDDMCTYVRLWCLVHILDDMCTYVRLWWLVHMWMAYSVWKTMRVDSFFGCYISYPCFGWYIHTIMSFLHKYILYIVFFGWYISYGRLRGLILFLDVTFDMHV